MTDPNARRWMILFKETNDKVPARDIDLLGLFHDWRSWLSLFAAQHTGHAAEMTVYGQNGPEACKVILTEQYTSRSNYDNPFGQTSYGPSPNDPP